MSPLVNYLPFPVAHMLLGFGSVQYKQKGGEEIHSEHMLGFFEPFAHNFLSRIFSPQFHI